FRRNVAAGVLVTASELFVRRSDTSEQECERSRRDRRGACAKAPQGTFEISASPTLDHLDAALSPAAAEPFTPFGACRTACCPNRWAKIAGLDREARRAQVLCFMPMH